MAKKANSLAVVAAASAKSRRKRLMTANPTTIVIEDVGRALGGKKPKLTRLRFGSVTLNAPQADRVVVERNIADGQAALARGAAILKSPGVKINHRKGVPLYAVDPAHPNQLVRVVDGVSQRGRFEGGEFKVIE